MLDLTLDWHRNIQLLEEGALLLGKFSEPRLAVGQLYLPELLEAGENCRDCD